MGDVGASRLNSRLIGTLALGKEGRKLGGVGEVRLPLKESRGRVSLLLGRSALCLDMG